jgi:hypothetical protein
MINLRVKTGVKERWERAASSSGVSLSEFIRDAVEAWIVEGPAEAPPPASRFFDEPLPPRSCPMSVRVAHRTQLTMSSLRTAQPRRSMRRWADPPGVVHLRARTCPR